ncbi:MAG: hypothetical protein GY755_08295 [Chloroflexi bacterium]|nr:hypothetical protein [Chloroflexota bacterium]
MKKITFALLIIFSLTLSACGAGVTPETASVNSALSTNYENALSIQLQLSIGTFNLEGTDLAVDAAQATDLIPLWQVLKNLTESGSAAEEEIAALILQIEEAMTSKQIASIATMNLTREDMGAIMQEYALMGEMANGETPPEGFTPGQGRGGGSGVPGLEGGGRNIEGMSPEEIETARAEREAKGESGNMMNSRLSGMIIDGLIILLESK